jgi:hypothetical protein
MAETRKLAAILAADVAGYSRLAGADEERTLTRHFPKVSVDILKSESRQPKSQQGPFWTPTRSELTRPPEARPIGHCAPGEGP